MADSDDKDPKNYLLAGALVVVLGIGYFVFFFDRGGDDGDGIGCQVTAAGIAIIASGLTHGRPTTQIVANAVVGIGALDACNRVVDAMKEEPRSPVTLEVVTPQGTGDVSVTGSELLRPVGRTTCADWLTAESQAACYDGQIGPPIIDLNPGQPTCADWFLPSFVEGCRQGAIGVPSQD